MKKTKGLYRRAGSPYWWIHYTDGNRGTVRESTNTCSKKLAAVILSKKRANVAEGKHLDKKRNPQTTFFELLEQYTEAKARTLRMKGFEGMVTAWKKSFGNVPCSKLTESKIEKYLNSRKDLSATSKNRHLTILRSVFSWGLNLKEPLVSSNPTLGIKKDKRAEEAAKRNRYLNHEEIQRLLSLASDGFRPILVTALHTGMRRGEILSLKWADVDLKARNITVRKTKGGKNREIKMNDTLVETLKNLPSRFQKNYVFPSPVKPGKPYTDVNHTFNRLTRKAEIEDCRFHDLRATFASQMVMSGADLKTVQELLGHSSLTMTQRYAHLSKAHVAQAVQNMDNELKTAQLQHTEGKYAQAGSDKSFRI